MQNDQAPVPPAAAPLVEQPAVNPGFSLSTPHTDAGHTVAGVMVVLFPFVVLGTAMLHKRYCTIRRRRNIEALERMWSLSASHRRDKR